MIEHPIVKDTYVLSDLHIAEGNLGSGEYLGTENFFADIEFQQCIDTLLSKHNTPQTQARIIINGDVVDFIRTTTVPKKDEISIWQRELDLVDADIKVELASITPKEVNYGLKTNDYKTIWKLYLIMRGHPKVFSVLARWVGQGNLLTIGVGNHDPEWYWPLVQKYFIVKLHQLYNAECPGAHLQTFKDSIDYYMVGMSPYDKVWIEHGNNYERLTKMCSSFEYHECSMRESFWYRFRHRNKPAIPQRNKELFLPYGSFFNRYLINKVEFKFPNVNNLTTGKALISTIFEEDFGTAFHILRHYGLYCFQVLIKSIRRSIVEVLIFAIVTLVPLGLFAWGINNSLTTSDPLFSNLPSWANSLIEGLRNAAFFLLRYVFKYLFEKIGITDKPLPDSALQLINPGGKYEEYDIILFGHNHTPDHQTTDNGKQYLNTGSWIRKYIFTFKQIQTGDVYALVHLALQADGSVKPRLLQWDKTLSMLSILPSFKNT